jgi:uncharacterized protein YkwD
MKINIFSSVCAVVVVFAHFLSVAPVTHAQNTPQISPIAGLVFDTPLPEKYTKKNFSLHFLASYDMKATDILTVKKSMPTPITVTSATTSSSVLDLLVPPVLAEESTSSSELVLATSIQNTEIVPTELNSPTPEPSTQPKSKNTEVVITPKATIKPTSTPTEKPSSSPIASIKPLPTVAPTSTPTPTAEPAVNTGGLSADKIFDLVNNYRSSKGLPPVQKDERACEVARSRAPEIAAEISGGYMHKGIRERALPYFNSEIIISMRSEEAAVQWWINDYIHRVQMEGDYKYSCAACSGNSCVQEFTNFVPRG